MGATTVSIDIWADELMVAVPGCTPTASQQALKSALREFTVQSGAWLRELPPISLKDGKVDYYLDPQPDAAIMYIMVLNYVDPGDVNGNGSHYTRRLVPLQAQTARLARTVPMAQPFMWQGESETPGKFTLIPAVTKDIDKCIYPWVALTMKEPWDGRVPFSFQRFHFDKILDGAIGRLMGQQDKTYTNPQMAQYHLRRFRNGIAAARDMSRRQFTTAQTEPIFPRWSVL